MKKISKKQKQIFCGLVAALLLITVVISIPSGQYSQVEISDQSMPLGNYSQEQEAEIAQKQEALNEANDKLALAKQAEEEARLALTAAQTAVASADSGLIIAETIKTTAESAATTASAAAAAAPDDEALALAASAAQTTLETANADFLVAQNVLEEAGAALPLAQGNLDTAIEETAAAQAEVDAAAAALEEAGGTPEDDSTNDADSDTNEDNSVVEEDSSIAEEEGDDTEDSSEALEEGALASPMLMMASDLEEDAVETQYQVILNVLNNKLLQYNNATSDNAYIQAISTEYKTLTPELEQDEEGNVTAVTVSAEAFAEAGIPVAAVGYSDFIGWSTTMDLQDTAVIPTNAVYSFDMSSATENEEGIITFNLYAKYEEIAPSGVTSIRANGQVYQPLAYPASDLAATDNLPASVLYEPIQSEYLEALDSESGSLYGHKDAAWENYDDGIGSIQFDFIMEPQTYDTDIVIVLDKSTGMPSGYVNNGISNWAAAVQAVNNLAQGLMGEENSANNRVALVQFSGNTVNSFNFQNNWSDFDSRFVETTPSGCNYFRDAQGNMIQDYGTAPAGAIENPAGDGTNYTVALEQARVFAESRGETDRELVVMFVSDGRPEALVGYSNPTRTRAWTQTYDGVEYHSTVISSSEDVANPSVVAANGQSVLAGFSPTIYTIGLGTASNADSLIALSSQTGGIHNSIGWAQENDIDSLSNIADTIFGESELLTEMTDAIITDVITEEFSLLIDEDYPVTLQRANDEPIVLTRTQGSVPSLNEYLVETIDYNGATREQIVINIGTVDRELLSVKFFVKTSSADIVNGNYPTNEEHTLTYKENDEPKSRDNLGEPELTVDSGEPPFVLLPTVPQTTPEGPTEDTPEANQEEPTSEATPETTTPQQETQEVAPTEAAAVPAAPAAVPAAPAAVPAAPADFAIELPGGITLELPDAVVPLAAALENASIEIGDTVVPLANFGESWALLNLLLTVATALGSLALLVGYFVRKKRDEADSEEDENQEEEPARLKRKGLARLLSVPVALIAVIVFVLTEDMTLPMTIMDEWTLLMLLIFVGQMLLCIASRKKFAKEDNKPKHAA